MLREFWPIKQLLRAFSASTAQLIEESPVFEQIRINQGRLWAEMNRSKSSSHLQDFEFKVFSQWGEDGILQHLIHAVPIAHQTFIEFGVENFSEANCRFLLMHDNWSGYVMDGSETHVQKIRSSNYFWKHQLTAKRAFITQENINELLNESGFDHDLGILSVDIDGVDYWVLKAINQYRPRILVLEYNAVFGSERKITVPYDAAFYRTSKHASNLYFGASLAALTDLARQKGYALVGTNSHGVNAFFVRQDVLPANLRSLTAQEAFTASKTRESRDAQGNLTFVSGAARIELIRGLPVVNTETGQTEPL